MKAKVAATLLSTTLVAGGANAWSVLPPQQQKQPPTGQRKNGLTSSSSNNRRQFLSGILTSGAAVVATGTVATVPGTAQAAMTEDNRIFTGQPISVEFAKERFKLAKKDIQYLLDHYDEICEGGGDNVRRYLGYVGTTSGLFGIQKVMKVLQDEADDYVAFTEDMEEFNSYLAGAEGAAYSAIFVVSSTSGDPPEKYYKIAKKNINKMKFHMENMAKELNL